MLHGPTGESDQVAIIAIFKQSDEDEIKEVLTPTLGLSLQDIETDLSSENLQKLFAVLAQKLPTIGKPHVERNENPEEKDPACTVGRAIKISFAHQQAESIVARTIQLMDAFIADPGKNVGVQTQLNCYFNQPGQAEIKRIRADLQALSSTLPMIKYNCPAKDFKSFRTSGGDVFEAEPGLEARALVEQDTGKQADAKTSGTAASTPNLKVIIFPEFFDTEPRHQARVFIHEAFHHAKKQGTVIEKDRHYNPACGSLSHEEALNNADSYALFAMALNPAGATPKVEAQKEEGKIQRKALESAESATVPPILHDVVQSSGQPLDDQTRAKMELQFGHDFSEVRVHTGVTAAESAREVNAAAYTVGNDIVIGDEHEPGTDKGNRLLAHELTHVVQQSKVGPSAAQTAKAVSDPSDAAEVEADQAALRIATGKAVEVRQTPSATVQSLSPGEAIGAVVAGAVGVGAVLGTLALLGVFDTSKFVDCEKPKGAQDAINAATKTAEKWINNAISKIDSVLALGDKAEPFVLEELHQHFKIGPTQKKDLNTLRQNFVEIQSGFGRIEFECESDCGSNDELLPGYVNAPLPRRIHLCPDWFNSDDIVRAETIAHEMAHRFAGKGEDIAYRKKSMNTYNALPTELALKNADSFSQFAKVLFNIGNLKASDKKPENSKESDKLERKAIGSAISGDVPPSVHEALNSPAQPLNPTTRASMEPRFERDFGHVRVHTDAKAAQSAEDVNATAYTVGSDVVFGAGQYAPETSPGRKLLAHELTHVAQQKDSPPLYRQALEVDRDAGSEEEADRVGERIAQGGFASESVTGVVETGAIRRQEAEPEADKEPEDTISYEEGGIPNLDPGRGMGGHPPPESCIERLWAREFPRVFRLDTISVIGLTSVADSDKKEDVRAARLKNRDFVKALAILCAKYETVQHPFRVRLYFVEVDLRTPPGDKIETDDGKKNRELGAQLGAGPTPRLLVYVERNLQLRENFSSDTKDFEKKLEDVIKEAGTSGATKGAKTGAVMGAFLGGFSGLVVGLNVGSALAAGGMATAAAAGLGILAGLGVAAAAIAGTALIGALIGHAAGTDRGTAELSKEKVKEVQAFVALLGAKGELKGSKLTDRDSDDLARDAVTLWIDRPSALPLTVKLRRLLIKVMLDGPTLDDDERAIIKLLENSTDAEILEILDTTADKKERVTLQDLDNNIHGVEWPETRKMLQARFPTLGAPSIERTDESKENHRCEADQAIMIMEARKRATAIISIAIQRLADFQAAPAQHQGVRNSIGCYFPFFRPEDVRRIKAVLENIQALIPTRRFVCPLPDTTMNIERPVGPTKQKCSGVAMTIVWPENEEGTFGARPETYVCPVFFERSPDYQTTTVLHEWVHQAAPELNTEAYEVKCDQIAKEEALDNAESFALLAFRLADGGPANIGGVPSVTIGNFRNTGMVTPENRCLSCPNIPSLGPDPASGQNFMELTGTIAGHRPDALYDFKRTKEVSVWGLRDDSWKREKFEPPGTLDDASSADEDVAPKNDRIYSIDGPGVQAPLPSTGDPSIQGGVYKGNFIETVNVKVGQGPWTPASNSFLWHSVTWFERGADGLLRR
ncbi:MAG: eCIS core domain-containing protein, partial [Pyrinomonadaceae bacterium]